MAIDTLSDWFVQQRIDSEVKRPDQFSRRIIQAERKKLEKIFRDVRSELDRIQVGDERSATEIIRTINKRTRLTKRLKNVFNHYLAAITSQRLAYYKAIRGETIGFFNRKTPPFMQIVIEGKKYSREELTRVPKATYDKSLSKRVNQRYRKTIFRIEDIVAASSRQVSGENADFRKRYREGLAGAFRGILRFMRGLFRDLTQGIQVYHQETFYGFLNGA